MKTINSNNKIETVRSAVTKNAIKPTTVIQRKLKLGKPNDHYEQEANRVADKVVSNQAPLVQRQCPGQGEEEAIQMKPIGLESITPLQRQPMEEEEEMLQPKLNRDQTPWIQRQEEEEEAIQPKENNGSRRETATSSWVESGIKTARGGGSPLPNNTRSFMETRFGTHFNSVRIHTNNRAAQMNNQINAQAFTSGNDIFFNRGKYNTGTQSGKRLLAHELTHTIQQNSSQKLIQGNFAVAPTTPNRRTRTLSTTRIQSAIIFNQARHNNTTEIALMRDILGLSTTPSVIDTDFVNAVVDYQAQYGLHQDGKLGHDTADRLAKEVIAEGNFLGAGNLGSLAPEFQTKTNIRALITANNRSYAVYKSTIQADTMVQGHVALNDQQLLRDLKLKLSWNNWARCIELLGRRTPSGNRMRRNATVRGAMRTAWTASTPALTRWSTPIPGHVLAPTCNPVPAAPATTAHEEGGFIYMNLITGILSTRSVAAGAQAALTLNNPPNVANSIVVGGYHTHPNVGNCWGAPFFSTADTTWSSINGVPLLMIGAFPAIANTSFHATGSTRLYLAGNRGLPGAAGGLAPQATIGGTHDEL